MPLGLQLFLMGFACVALCVAYANICAIFVLIRYKRPLPWLYFYYGGMACISLLGTVAVLYINPIAIKLKPDNHVALEYLWPREDLVAETKHLVVAKTRRWDGWRISFLNKDGRMGDLIVYRRESNIVQKINEMAISGIRLE